MSSELDGTGVPSYELDHFPVAVLFFNHQTLNWSDRVHPTEARMKQIARNLTDVEDGLLYATIDYRTRLVQDVQNL